jgi:hypothetical protein
MINIDITVMFKDYSIKSYLKEEFDVEENIDFHGEWELGHDDDTYELYFYEYSFKNNTLYFSKANRDVFDEDGCVDCARMLEEIRNEFAGYDYIYRKF